MIRRINSWREFRTDKSPAPSVDVSDSGQWGQCPSPVPSSAKLRESGEQPIYTTKAHVFQIDPQTRRDWVPASQSSVPVSFYHDSRRNCYRIICVEGAQAIINSTLTPNMTFNRTSQKFGQWADLQANTVYGVGFPSEQELNKFFEKFKEIKELASQTSNQKHSGMNGQIPSPLPTRQALHQRTSSFSFKKKDGSSLERSNSFSQGSNGSASSNNLTEDQLKYENERLKMALAQSSANNQKWEVELQMVKSNNLKLTTALQESTANVEEWKKQLATYKEETIKLKRKLLEQDRGNERADQPHSFGQLSSELERLTRDNRNKHEEIHNLNKELEELRTQDAGHSTLRRQLKVLEDENTSLREKLQDTQKQLHDWKISQEHTTRECLQLQEGLGTRLTELMTIHTTLLGVLRRDMADTHNTSR